VSWNPIKPVSIVCAATALWAAAPETVTESEDALIVRALLDEEVGALSQSRQIYETLFRLTGKKEYLLQEAKDALVQKSDPQHSIDNLVKWITAHPEDRDAALYRMLVALYVEQGSLEDAEDVADEYLGDDASAEDQIAVAALKQELGKPKEAVEILKRSYEKEENEKVLLELVTLLDRNLKRPEEAAALLQQHLAKHDEASVGVYFKLIELYAREKKLEEVAALYKKLYERDPQKYFLQKIIEISLYRKDIDGVIRFLEKHPGNEEILFTFYKEKRAYTKAIETVRKLYRRTHDPKWLAEEGILVYEQAKRSRAIDPHSLKQMQTLMDQAMQKGLENALYYNYYGYTLIDHDLDIDRGIKLVEKALKKNPYNTYYLDSLAWGLYKKGNCDKAYEIMKKVVAKEGLSEEEIKTHWDLIRGCYLK